MSDLPPIGAEVDPSVPPIGTEVEAPPGPEVDLEQQARLAKWATEVGSQVAPDRNADVLRLSAVTGMDPQLVHDHFDVVKQEVDAKKVDYKALARDHPAIARFIGNPERAGMVRDDIAKLRRIDWLLGPMDRTEVYTDPVTGEAGTMMVPSRLGFWAAPIRDAFLAAEFGLRKSWDLAKIGLRPMMGRPAPGYLFTDPVTGVQGWVQKPPEEWQTADTPREAELRARIGAKRDYGIEDIDSAVVRELAKAYETVAGFAPMILGTVAAAAVGGPAGAAGFNLALFTGPEYDARRKTLEAAGKAGEPEAEGEAIGSALSVGGTNAVLALLGFKPVFRGVGKLVGLRVLEEGGAAAIPKIMADETVWRVLRRGAVEYGKDYLQGMATLQAMSLVSSLSQEKFRADVMGQDFDWEPVGEAQLQTARDNALAMLFLSGLSIPARRYIAEVGRASEIARNQGNLAEAVRQARDLKVTDVSPAEAQALLAQLGDRKTFFLDKEGFDAIYTPKNVDPREVISRVLGDNGKAYDQAAATGGDILVPSEVFLIKLAKTADGLALTEISSFEQGQNLYRSKRYSEELRKKVQAQADAAIEAGRKSPYEEIKEDFAKKIEKAGLERLARTDAADIAARIYTWMGAEKGTDPVELYKNEFPIRILTEDILTLENLDRLIDMLNQPGFHGTRVRGIDKFKTEYIGTGQGAQSYGWGLYFAERRGVAENYRQQLARGSIGVGGKTVPNLPILNASTAMEKTHNRLFAAWNAAQDAGDSMTAEEAIQRVRSDLKKELDRNPNSKHASSWSEQLAALAEVERSGLQLEPRGQVYKVDLPDKEALLDWDKPLSEQSPGVLEKLKAMADGKGALHGWTESASQEARDAVAQALAANYTGEGLRDLLHRKMMDLRGEGPIYGDDVPRAVSEALGEAGIPGLKYLDQGSRGTTEKQTHNFVIWDEASIKILETLYQPSIEGHPVKVETQRPPSVRYQGKDAWLFVVDMRDGHIIESVTYDQAADAGFHHAEYLRKNASIEGLDQSTAQLLWFDREGVMSPSPLHGAARKNFEKAIRKKVEFARETNWLPAGGEGPLFQEGKGPPERAKINITVDIAGKKISGDIILGESADPSSLPHELLHFFERVMGELVEQPGASQGLKDTYQAILREQGFASKREHDIAAGERIALKAQETRTPAEEKRLKKLTAAVEKIPHLFEQYLGEGKAPTKELLPLFARYVSWISRIYGDKGVQAQFRRAYGQELGPVSGEIRNVFDRLLAGEEAMREASASLFAELPAVPFTPEEKEQSDKALEEARAEGEASVRTLLTSEAKAADREFMRSERVRFRREAEAEVDAEKVYAAIRAIRLGEFGGITGKFDRAEVEKTFGKDVVKVLPDDLFVKVLGDALPTNMIAELTSYGSSEEMIRAMVGAVPRETAVARRTADKMRAKYPGLQDRPALLADLAKGELAGPAFLRDGAIRLRAMAREAGMEVRTPSAAELQASAEAIVEGIKYTDQRPDRYDRMAQSLAKQIARTKDAKKRLDLFEAYLLNRALVRASTEARAMHGKARRQVEPYTTDEGLAKLGKAFELRQGVIAQPHLEAMVTLLEGFDLKKSSTLRDVHSRADQRAALERFVAERRADGEDIVIPDSVLKQLTRTTSWKDLTLREMSDLRDAVLSIAQQADLRRTFIIGGQILDKEVVVEALKAGTLAATGRRIENPLGGEMLKSMGAKASQIGRSLVDLVERPEILFRALDGGKDDGPWQRYVWKPMSDSSYQFYDLVRETAAEVQGIFRDLPAAERKRLRGTFTVDGERYTIENAITAAANCANESNMDKMIRGMSSPRLSTDYGKVPWFGRRTLDQILSHLTQKDVDIVNAIVRACEKNWDKSVALEKEMTGLPPKKVEGRKFTFKGADGKELTIDGGYYPMIYSYLFKVGKTQFEADSLAANGLPGLFSPHYDRAMTPQGHLESRIPNFTRPIDLTLDALPRKLVMTSKDIAFRRTAVQLYRVLTDERVAGAITQAHGAEGYKAVMGWLRDSVNDVMIPDAGAGIAMAGIAKLRSLASQAIFGLNVGQALQNLADFTGVGAEVPAKYVADAVLQFNRHPVATYAQIRLESGEMRIRADKYSESLSGQMRDVFKKSELAMKWDHAKDLMMIPFETTTRMVEGPVYLAAKNHWLAEHPGDATGSVSHAEGVVRALFGGRRTVDLPPVMRDKILRNFVMFHGWANAQLNLFLKSTQTAGAQGAEGWTVGRRFRALKILTKIYATLWAKNVASELLVGKAPEDYNGDGTVGPDDWGRWAALRGVLTVPMSMPVAGPIIRGVVGSSTARDVSLTPWTNLFNVAAKAGQAAKTVATGFADGESPQDDEAINLFLAWLEFGGAAIGAPVSQIRSTGRYWAQPTAGQDLGQDILGTMYGPPRPGKLGDLLLGE